jgi:hypothetical protein
MMCLRIAELATGRIIAHSTRQKSAKEQKEEVNLLTAQHLKKWWKFIDMWVVPTTTVCQYALLRIIMWCREGRLVGMLPSNDAVWRRNHHNTEPHWIVNVSALVTHILSLYTGGRWPDGSAPIILAGTTDQYLKSVKKQLIEQDFPPDECARLRGVPFTLSAQGAKEDFDLEAFVDAPHLPRWGSVLLVERTRQTCDAGRLRERSGRSRDDKTDKGMAWQNMLLPN